MPPTAVLICGHGSRAPEGPREFAAVVAALRPRLAPLGCAAAYLEFARPTIAEGLAALAETGARRIVMVPAMLLAGRHIRIDLPGERRRFAIDHPDIEVRLGAALGFDRHLRHAASERIAAAIGGAAVVPADTLLVVVGRGSIDDDANAAVAAIAARLREDFGFAAVATAFSGLAEPALVPVLTQAARAGWRHIVIFPYFLFTGVLVKRIGDQVAAIAGQFPETRFAIAAPLGDHPGVIAALAERAAALIEPATDV